MKNIQKFSIAVTFIIFSSVACSSNSTKEVSSVMKNSSISTEQVSSDISSIIKNPVVGTKVTLQGKIVKQMEDCYIFTDGNNKIMIHFEDEISSYDPNAIVEISGTVEEEIIHDSEHFKAGHNHDNSIETMIMVEQMEVIASNKK